MWFLTGLFTAQPPEAEAWCVIAERRVRPNGVVVPKPWTPRARGATGFSKKSENHAAMVALYFMFYNFGRVRVTPAMESGIATHVWSIEEIVGLL
jgi:hypothetical protein